MKKITAILLPVILVLSCKYDPGVQQNELREHLKTAMTDFLYKQTNGDSSTVKWNVLEVTYFANPDEYRCEFKVRMRKQNVDTTGMMMASISKDMKRVYRGY